MDTVPDVRVRIRPADGAFPVNVELLQVRESVIELVEGSFGKEGMGRLGIVVEVGGGGVKGGERSL